jgi:flagellar basal-body rod protein FlgF
MIGAAKFWHLTSRFLLPSSNICNMFLGIYISILVWPDGCTLQSAMDPMTATAASGLRARMESLDLLANNIANTSTEGYKADREFYTLYTAPEAESDPTATMPLIERPWIDFSQGTLHATGNPLDLALSGKGFFAVNGPSGALYTRNGNFQISATGTLVTGDGFAIRGAGGQPLALNAALPVDVTADGTVRQGGNMVGQIEIADFASSVGLAKQGNNYLRVADPAVRPAAATGTTVGQGRLEASNASAGESAVRLVSVMRQFEMLQKAVSLGTEMNRRAVEEVAKVGS